MKVLQVTPTDPKPPLRCAARQEVGERHDGGPRVVGLSSGSVPAGLPKLGRPARPAGADGEPGRQPGGQRGAYQGGHYRAAAGGAPAGAG